MLWSIVATFWGHVVLIHESSGHIAPEPEQNGCHFADDIFERLDFNENCRILITISPKFVDVGQIENDISLSQVMAWRWTGDKP